MAYTRENVALQEPSRAPIGPDNTGCPPTLVTVNVAPASSTLAMR